MDYKVNHNMNKWFMGVNVTPLVYFNTKFEGNRLGSFKVPRSVQNNFGSVGLERFFNAMGQSYIELVLKLKPILRNIPFEMLEERDKYYLREFICEQVQFSVSNRQIIQTVNASTISTPAFSMNVDTTPWAFTSDMLSMRGRLYLQNAEIDLYDIIEEDRLVRETDNGNIIVLRKVDLKDVPGMIWD